MNRRDTIKLLALLTGCTLIPATKETSMKNQYDVLIIGGGPAGLSAALTLARGKRSVLLFDDQKPRNLKAKHMQNFPSRDGLSPSEFKRLAIVDLKKYPNVQFENNRVDDLRIESGFKVLANGKEFYGRKILLAHGMKDKMLELPGFKELWGHSIFQCPYCHGYELQNTSMALIGSGMIAKHMLPILTGLTDDLILFTNGEEVEDPSLILKNGIKIYTEKIIRFEREGDSLKSVRLANGISIERRYLFIKVPQFLSTNIATQIGCKVNEMGFYEIDEMGKTSVNGIFAAGDIVSTKQSVLGACAAGQLTGAAINYELLSENFRQENNS